MTARAAIVRPAATVRAATVTVTVVAAAVAAADVIAVIVRVAKAAVTAAARKPPKTLTNLCCFEIAAAAPETGRPFDL